MFGICDVFAKLCFEDVVQESIGSRIDRNSAD